MLQPWRTYHLGGSHACEALVGTPASLHTRFPAVRDRRSRRSRPRLRGGAQRRSPQPSQLRPPDGARVQRLSLSVPHADAVRPQVQAQRIHAHQPGPADREGLDQRWQAEPVARLAARRDGDRGRYPHQGRPARHAERRRGVAPGAERFSRGTHQLADGTVLTVHLLGRRWRVRDRQRGYPVRQQDVDRQRRAGLRGDAQQQPLGAGSMEHDAGVGLPVHRLGCRARAVRPAR